MEKCAGRHVVLIIENLMPGATINGEELSSAERADLNRGRVYLKSIATENNIPIGSSMAEGMEHLLRLLEAARAESEGN